MSALEHPEQAGIATLSRALAAGEISALELARHHLDRIEALDGTFKAVIELNPDALDIATACDRAREPTGPLHGIRLAGFGATLVTVEDDDVTRWNVVPAASPAEVEATLADLGLD